MKKEQIIKAWNDFGINNYNDYHKHITNREDYYRLSNHFKNVLDPDVISPIDFWEASDIVFGIDPVCNSQKFQGKDIIVQHTIETANESNYNIAYTGGLIAALARAILHFKMSDMPEEELTILEVGAGYGSFYENYIKKEKWRGKYLPYDIIPRFSGVARPESSNGTFSEEQITSLKDTVDIIFSSNVTQHLSKKQNVEYLKQYKQILKRGGVIISTFVCSPMMHYGQYIEHYSIGEWRKIFMDMNFTLDQETIVYSSHQPYKRKPIYPLVYIEQDTSLQKPYNPESIDPHLYSIMLVNDK